MTPGEIDALLAAPSLLAEALATPADGELAAGTRLRASYEPSLVAAAFAQAELRRRGRAKFSRADRMLFTRDGLEQASTEVVARHRAQRLAGLGRLADLCCGIGGDLVALAAGREVVAVDRDVTHLRLAEHNTQVYDVGAGVRYVAADVRDVVLDVDAVFLDPARRSGGTRLGPTATEPPLDWALGLAETVPAVVKAAPGLPHTAVPRGWEIEFVSVAGDLKEACLWSPQLAGATTRATLLPGGDTLLPSPGERLDVADPGAWLLDPDPAVTRAGLVQELGRQLGAWQIDPRIAFLSGDAALRSPFGRSHRVIASLPFRLKDIAAQVRAHGIGALDVRRRGLAGDVEDIRRRLPLAGPVRATLMLTRVRDRPWAMLCVDDDHVIPDRKADAE
jgi:predicted RNA methylase